MSPVVSLAISGYYYEKAASKARIDIILLTKPLYIEITKNATEGCRLLFLFHEQRGRSTNKG